MYSSYDLNVHMRRAYVNSGPPRKAAPTIAKERGHDLSCPYRSRLEAGATKWGRAEAPPPMPAKQGAACCAPTKARTKRRAATVVDALCVFDTRANQLRRWFAGAKGYSWEPESPPGPPSLPEPPGLCEPPLPAAAFCCFSRASLMRALRERRTLLPSIERTLTRT